MSVNYGGPPAGGAAYGGGGYVPPRRASFEWINEAWRLFSEQAGTWIVSCIVAVLLPVVLYFILAFAFGLSAAIAGQGRNGTVGTGFSAGLIIFIALFWMIYGLLYMPFIFSGVYRMAVRQIRGEPIGIGDIFGGAATTLNMLGYQIVFGLLGFLVTLVLTIPLTILHVLSLSMFTHPNPANGAMPDMTGFFIWYVLVLVCFAVVTILFFPVHAQIADGEGVMSAMSRSMAAMKTQILPTFGILFVFGLLYMVSAIPCGLGLLVTVPMFWLISALAYRDMVGMPGGSNAAALGMSGAYGAAQPGVWPPPPGARPPAFGQPPTSDPSSFSPPRRTLGGEDIDGSGQPPLPPPAA